MERPMNAYILHFLASVKEICPTLSQEELHYFAKKLTIEHFSPKEYYLEAKAAQKGIAIIVKGLFRVFYINEEGSEITISFSNEGRLMGDFTSIDHPEPSRFCFQCIEKSVVIACSYEHLQDCSAQFPALEKYFRIMLERVFQRISNRLLGILSKNSEEMYREFINENPELASRISVSHLCSFLGVSRQTLTRIRRKMLEE